MAEPPRKKPGAPEGPAPEPARRRRPAIEIESIPPPAPAPAPVPVVEPLPTEPIPSQRSLAARRSSPIPWLLGGAFALAIVSSIWAFWGDAEDPHALCQDATLSLANSSSVEIEATLYASSGPGLDARAGEIHQLLLELAEQAGEKLKVFRVNVEANEVHERARSLGLDALFGDEAPSSKAPELLGLTLHAGAAKTTLRLSSRVSIDYVRFALAQRLRSLLATLDGKKIQIGLLTGLDELGIGDGDLLASELAGGASAAGFAGLGKGAKGPSFRSLLEARFPHYEFVEISLGEPTIDQLANLSALIVTQPGRTLTARERDQLDEFMMLGGRSLLVLASAVNVSRSDPHMMATLDRHGLELLLLGYGVELGNDVVLDGAMTDPAPHDGAPQPAVLVAHRDSPDARSFDPTFLPFAGVDALALPYASSLTLEPSRQPGAKLRAVISSSPSARALPHGATLNAAAGPLPKAEPAGRRVLAASVEGSITSAFRARRAQGRILVIASSQFITNPYQRAAAGNRDALLSTQASSHVTRHLDDGLHALGNALDWATTDGQLSTCSTTLAPD